MTTDNKDRDDKLLVDVVEVLRVRSLTGDKKRPGWRRSARISRSTAGDYFGALGRLRLA